MSDKRPITEPGPISALESTPTQINDQSLKPFGYAPGNYMGTCRVGHHQMHDVDKRASCCREHAIFKLHQEYLIVSNDNRKVRLELTQLKETHDKRVRELLQAASREVIRRREINAHRIMLLGFVIKACKQLRFYAHNHREKVFTQKLTAQQIMDTQEKARVNDNLAQEGEEAAIWESPTGAMGTP